MSYGTRKAIAGGMRATEKAIVKSDEAIMRFDNCKSVQEIREVLKWMKEQDFFFLPSDNHVAMKAAFDRARERTEVKL